MLIKENLLWISARVFQPLCCLLIHAELAENVNVMLNWDSQTRVEIRNSYHEIIIINNCWKYISGREDFQSIIVFFKYWNW